MESTPNSITGALRLNGVIWLSIVLLVLSIIIDHGSNALRYIFVITGVAGVGALVNLGLSLWKYATDRDRASPYLIASIPLALLFWWFWHGLHHMGKMSG